MGGCCSVPGWSAAHCHGNYDLRLCAPSFDIGRGRNDFLLLPKSAIPRLVCAPEWRGLRRRLKLISCVDPRQTSAGPRPLEVVSADPAIYVEDFAAQK